jgi:hypothetical protein
MEKFLDMEGCKCLLPWSHAAFLSKLLKEYLEMREVVGKTQEAAGEKGAMGPPGQQPEQVPDECRRQGRRPPQGGTWTGTELGFPSV